MGVEIFKKTNLIINIRYEIPKFLPMGSVFKEGGEESKIFCSEAEIFGIFSVEVAPYFCII